MEGYRQAYLTTRQTLRKGMDKVVQDAVEISGPGDRNDRRTRRMISTRREEARKAADLAGRRYARTIMAKACHKVEAVFGRNSPFVAND